MEGDPHAVLRQQRDAAQLLPPPPSLTPLLSPFHQVTRSGVRLVDTDGQMLLSSWAPPAGLTVNMAAGGPRQVGSRSYNGGGRSCKERGGPRQVEGSGARFIVFQTSLFHTFINRLAGPPGHWGGPLCVPPLPLSYNYNSFLPCRSSWPLGAAISFTSSSPRPAPSRSGRACSWAQKWHALTSA